MSDKIKCPHCGDTLLWSDDRGAHCDGCDAFDPERDLPPPSPERTPAQCSQMVEAVRKINTGDSERTEVADESDTPRCNRELEVAHNVALDWDCRKSPKREDEPPLVVPLEFARELERDLAALRKEKGELVAACRNFFDAHKDFTAHQNDWNADRMKVTAERLDAILSRQAKESGT